MEISYLSAPIFFVVAFVDFSYPSFRAARRSKTEGGREAGRSDARPGSLCSECMGAADLDADRMAECSSHAHCRRLKLYLYKFSGSPLCHGESFNR